MDIAYKQVIVVNEALRLPRGKLAAQAAHAAVGAMLSASVAAREFWIAQGMPKVVLREESAEALAQLYAAAQATDLPTCLVEDAGRTVVPAGAITCLGIGPAPGDLIDQLTGTLSLVR